MMLAGGEVAIEIVKGTLSHASIAASFEAGIEAVSTPTAEEQLGDDNELSKQMTPIPIPNEKGDENATHPIFPGQMKEPPIIKDPPLSTTSPTLHKTVNGPTDQTEIEISKDNFTKINNGGGKMPVNQQQQHQ
jgi:hypothetical protein